MRCDLDTGTRDGRARRSPDPDAPVVEIACKIAGAGFAAGGWIAAAAKCGLGAGRLSVGKLDKTRKLKESCCSAGADLTCHAR